MEKAKFNIESDYDNAETMMQDDTSVNGMNDFSVSARKITNGWIISRSWSELKDPTKQSDDDGDGDCDSWSNKIWKNTEEYVPENPVHLTGKK